MYVCRSGRYIEKFIPDPSPPHTHTPSTAHLMLFLTAAIMQPLVLSTMSTLTGPPACTSSSCTIFLGHCREEGGGEGGKEEGGREGGRERGERERGRKGEREEGREGRGREGGREGEREGVWVVTDTHVYTLRE